MVGRRGGTDTALERLERGIDRLGEDARALLALENDDRLFTVADLLPLCERTGVPLVYDVHHHRCHPDGLSVEEATMRAVATWKGREPYMHLSSPRDGWGSPNPRPHDAFVDPADFPEAWIGLAFTGRTFSVDVEAKDKERAVLAIRDAIESVLAQRRNEDVRAVAAAGHSHGDGAACVGSPGAA